MSTMRAVSAVVALLLVLETVQTVLGVPKECLLPPKTGECRAAFPRFYFDSSLGQCKRFIYGGCHGNGNNFLTVEACRSRCT